MKLFLFVAMLLPTQCFAQALDLDAMIKAMTELVQAEDEKKLAEERIKSGVYDKQLTKFALALDYVEQQKQEQEENDSINRAANMLVNKNVCTCEDCKCAEQVVRAVKVAPSVQVVTTPSVMVCARSGKPIPHDNCPCAYCQARPAPVRSAPSYQATYQAPRYQATYQTPYQPAVQYRPSAVQYYNPRPLNCANGNCR